jgi:hypothetical protein
VADREDRADKVHKADKAHRVDRDTGVAVVNRRKTSRKTAISHHPPTARITAIKDRQRTVENSVALGLSIEVQDPITATAAQNLRDLQNPDNCF